jgi:hypothetical protein
MADTGELVLASALGAMFRRKPAAPGDQATLVRLAKDARAVVAARRGCKHQGA